MSKFRPGQSGNPNGRPPHIADKRATLRSLLEPHAPALVQKAIDLALAGDSVAIRLCLDRLIPVLKPKDAPVRLPTLTGTLVQHGQAVLDALTTGKLTPDEASTVIQTVSAQARIIEIEELEKRVAALEATSADAERSAP